MSAISIRRLKTCLGLFLILFAFTALSSAPLLLSTTNIAVAQEEEVDEDAQAEAESCESNGGEFSFFVCPFLRLANDGVQFFDSQVRQRTQVDPNFYNGNEVNGENPLREIWGRMRNIAFVLLIPVMLILVIGTALGVGFVDAYTVKRAMPRLLFAVIFMALSYDVGAILIDLSNAASRGIQGLLVSAVGGQDSVALDALFNSNGAADTGLLVGGILGGAVALSVGALSIGILASFLGSAALGLLIIFLILLARQLIIVLCLVFLPLAMLSWIFPGNDKPWKLVWGTFTNLLYAGPIFAAFVVMGRILAYIVNVTTPETGGLEQIMLVGVKLFLVVGSMVGGVFVITRFAGAAGTVLGMANDRAKGLFDRNKNYRANKRKEKGELADNNTRFGGSALGSKKLAKWGNSLGRQARYAPTAMQGGGWKNPNRFRGNQRGHLETLSKNRIEEASQDKEFSVLLDWDNASAAFAEMLSMGITDRAGMKNFVDNDTDRFGDISDTDKNTIVAQMQGFREKYGDDRISGMAAVKALTVGGATDYKDAEGIAKVMALGAHFAGDSGGLKANFDSNVGNWLTAGGRAADAAGGSYGDRANRTSEAQTLIDRHSMEDIFGQGDRGGGGAAADAELQRLGGGIITDTLLHQDPRLMTDSKTKPYAMENLMGQANELIQNVDQLVADQRAIIANPATTTAERSRAEREVTKLETAQAGGVSSVLGKLDVVNKLYANANITASIDEGMRAPVLDVRHAPAPGAAGPTPVESVKTRVTRDQPEIYSTPRNSTEERGRMGDDGPGGPGGPDGGP